MSNTLWSYGAWQVRDDGVHAPYRELTFAQVSVASTHRAAAVSHDLLQTIPIESISYAEELDMLDALWTAGMWFQATPAAQQRWRPDVFPDVRPVLAPDRDDRIRSAMAERFFVLRRDGYRCQLCGNTAQDGARLEVDHKLAKANGGPDTIANKWTLCYDCNRGKGTEYL